MFDEALKEIKKSFEHTPGIEAVVLFGSVARREETPESDIDILVILPRRRKTLEKYISDTSLEIGKKYGIAIECITTTKRLDTLNRQFLDTILREGRVICGTLPDIPFQKLELLPYSLIIYDLSRMSHQEKMKIRLLLFGKETKKVYKGKTYVSKKSGYVEEYKGIRTGIASILIPGTHAKTVEQELRRRGARIRIIPAWLQRI